jgi:hypothetical protein
MLGLVPSLNQILKIPVQTRTGTSGLQKAISSLFLSAQASTNARHLLNYFQNAGNFRLGVGNWFSRNGLINGPSARAITARSGRVLLGEV